MAQGEPADAHDADPWFEIWFGESQLMLMMWPRWWDVAQGEKADAHDACHSGGMWRRVGQLTLMMLTLVLGFCLGRAS